VPARAFVGRYFFNPITEVNELFAVTYAGAATGSPALVPLQKWIKVDPISGSFIPVDVDGLTPGFGFPGTQSQFTGYQKLISSRTVIFVADTDGDLSTADVFPSGKELRLR